MKELLQGRRFGFALRPALASLAAGLAIAVTLLDLVSWGGWGVATTNPLVVASAWLAIATAVVALIGLAAALAESRDIPDEDFDLARLDTIAVAVAVVVYVAAAALRLVDAGAAAPSPLAFLLAVAGLIVVLVDAAMASILYAAREWEELEEIVHERPRRKRAMGR